MLVVDYLNLVFGNTSMSAEYWENHLLPLVEQTYAGVQASSLKQLVADRDRRLRRKSGILFYFYFIIFFVNQIPEHVHLTPSCYP